MPASTVFTVECRLVIDHGKSISSCLVEALEWTDVPTAIAVAIRLG